MRKHELTAVAALLAVAGALAACGAKRDDDENRRRYPTDTTYKVDPQTTIAAHRDFEDSIARRLDEVDRKVADLRSQATNAAKDEAKRLNDLADDIADKKDKAVNKLNDLREAASDKWEDVRVKADKAVMDAEDAVRDAMNRK